MDRRSPLEAIAVAAVRVAASTAATQAFDDAKYPDLSGQWLKLPVPGIVGQTGTSGPATATSCPPGRTSRRPT
jgi:hypothetical protein